MLDLQRARINTAGAYIRLDGRYVFALGIRPHNGNIPIVRLGGHREENETGWQCAVREVMEESNLPIKALRPRTTYVYNWDHLETEVQEIEWQSEKEQEPIPFLVIAHRHETEITLSVMYHAEAEGIPLPSSEVKGLLLLEQEEIQRLCQKPMTLAQYLESSGRAILKADFNQQLVLEPFAQLRLLSRILGTEDAVNV